MTHTPIFAAAIAICFAAIANAQTTASPSTGLLTAQEAIAIALNAQAGTVVEAELDEFEDKPAFDIEVLNDAGEEVEFKIDATTGDILNTWVDDDPGNDPLTDESDDTDS